MVYYNISLYFYAGLSFIREDGLIADVSLGFAPEQRGLKTDCYYTADMLRQS